MSSPEGDYKILLKRMSDYLKENNILSIHSSSYKKTYNYNLRSQEMFDALVDLYIPLFKAHWPSYEWNVKLSVPKDDCHPWLFAARIYISAWFYDLWVSNRDVVSKVSAMQYLDQYNTEHVFHYSQEYDSFLVLLNAAIRPTHIKGLPSNMLCMPVICEKPNWNDSHNPFGITNFSLDYEIFQGLLFQMKYAKVWRFANLVKDTLGRPSWLFDWHDNKCCAWFPAEENYTFDEATVAYVVGVACTPNIGLKDKDDWQDFPGGAVPAQIDPTVYKRAEPRHFKGEYEVRTIDVRNNNVDDCLKERDRPRKFPCKGENKGENSKQTYYPEALQLQYRSSTTAEEEDDGIITTPQLRIVDWVYYSLVIWNCEVQTHSRCLETIYLKF